MIENKVSNLKRAQKESLIKKELSKLFLEIKLSDKNLEDIYINNVQLSTDKSAAHVLFFSEKGQEYFEQKLPFLILYKPSVRKALSRILDSRYTPQVIFQYDKTFEKQVKIEALLDRVKVQDEVTFGKDTQENLQNQDTNTAENQDIEKNANRD